MLAKTGREFVLFCFVFGGPHLFKMADNGSPYFQRSRIDSLLIIIVGFMLIFSLPSTCEVGEETS
jgi:hypothetical protein